MFGAEEPVASAVAGGADTGSVVCVEVRAVPGGADAGSVVSNEVRTLAAGADTGSVVCVEVRAVAGGADASSVVSDEVRTLAAGADRGGVSVLVPVVSSALGDDISRASVAAVSDRRALVDVRRSPL